MADWTIKYWLGAFFGAMITYATTKYKRYKDQKAKIAMLQEGVLALLHDRLYQACQHYIHQDYIAVGDLDNLEYLYASYHALGGNGTGTELYSRCKNLPLRKEGKIAV